MAEALRPLIDRVLAVLARDGLLLESDANLPSISGLTVGGPVRGSWWSHPKANNIYQAVTELSSGQDLLVTKLISAKVTYVHRRLWPAVLSVATSRESWQLSSLSQIDLVVLLDRLKEARTDQIRALLGIGTKKVTDSSRTLERVLLVHSKEVHLVSGAHAKQLETWTRWSEAMKFSDPLPPVAKSKMTIEAVLTSLNERWAGRGRLPWLASTQSFPIR